MDRRHPTCIGRVKHVLGASVTVRLDDDLAGVAPIYRGQLMQVGQIGSLVLLPQGLVDLVGTVSLVGLSELVGGMEPTDVIESGERWLQIQLVGEIDVPARTFRRGVGNYPAIDDPVHFATAERLDSVFPSAGDRHVRVGALAAAESVPVCLDAAKFVVRHAAVVGSTGSGKTSAVSAMLQAFVDGEWPSANIVVVDPHGEYASAFDGSASVRSVLGSGVDGLRVPYWALSTKEIMSAFGVAQANHVFATRFAEAVADARRQFAKAASWLAIDETAINADTPVPFDIRAVWYALDYENREVRTVKNDPATTVVTSAGDAATLQRAEFPSWGAAGSAPHKGPEHGKMGGGPDLLRRGLRDRRLSFFMEPQGSAAGPDPLAAVVADWLGGECPVSVLDFSGVPTEAADAAVGAVLSLLFEVVVRSEATEGSVGKMRPVVVVLEEAHRFLGSEARTVTQAAANRIAREGRKYGLGLIMVSQRPTELPRTALAQCGTIMALRLASSEDQGAIRAALPDGVSGLAAALPSLRTHEAIVAGEAVVLPVRMRVDAPSPWPNAKDPDLASWRRKATNPDVAPALARWRETYE